MAFLPVCGHFFTPMDLDAYLDQIAPLSDTEKKEMLLRYFTGIMATMSREEVVNMREHFAAGPEQTPERTSIVEIIDGHLALREIGPEN